MTKTTMRIVERYTDKYMAWMRAHRNNAGHEIEMTLLTELNLVEEILVNDCNLGYEKVGEIRGQIIDKFYSELAK